MNRGTDWISWTMHGFVGALVGFFFGAALVTRHRHGFWLHGRLLFLFLVATALIGAGAGSLLGDRLWIRDHYRLFPPEAPKAAFFGKLFSALLIGIGILLASAAVLKQVALM